MNNRNTIIFYLTIKYFSFWFAFFEFGAIVVIGSMFHFSWSYCDAEFSPD